MNSILKKMLVKVLFGVFLVTQTVFIFPAAEQEVQLTEKQLEAFAGLRMQHWCVSDVAEKKALLWVEKEAKKEAKEPSEHAKNYSSAFKAAMMSRNFFDRNSGDGKPSEQFTFAHNLLEKVYFDQEDDEQFKKHVKGDIRDGLISGGHFYNNEHNRECLYSGCGVDICVVPPLGHKKGIFDVTDVSNSLNEVCQNVQSNNIMLSEIEQKIVQFKSDKVQSWQTAQDKCADLYSQFEMAWNKAMEATQKGDVYETASGPALEAYCTFFTKFFSDIVGEFEIAFNNLFAIGCCIDVDFDGIRRAQKSAGVDKNGQDTYVATIHNCFNKICGEKSTNLLPSFAKAIGDMKRSIRRLKLIAEVKEMDVDSNLIETIDKQYLDCKNRLHKKHHDYKNKAVQEIWESKLQLERALNDYLSCAQEVFYNNAKYLTVKKNSISFVKTIFKENVISSEDFEQVSIGKCLHWLIEGMLNYGGYKSSLSGISLDDIVDKGGHFFIDTVVKIKNQNILVRAWFSCRKGNRYLSLDSFYPLIDEPKSKGAAAAADDDQVVQGIDVKLFQASKWLFDQYLKGIRKTLKEKEAVEEKEVVEEKEEEDDSAAKNGDQGDQLQWDCLFD